jgi:Sec-independent protein translocase protein TatA
MFDSISWGELTVVIGLGLFVIGKKDLPRAAHVCGTQVGRVVGLLQGARARADRFASQNELRQLQRELQSGLRELDMVKSELAVSMTGGRMMSSGAIGMTAGQLGSMGPISSSRQLPAASRLNPQSMAVPGAGSLSKSDWSSSSDKKNSAEPLSSASLHHQQQQQQNHHSTLPPASQTIAAVAEEEWAKQGIAFKSRAELGAGLANYDASTSGSVLLANMIQQSLIFDQYDRVVAEQDSVLQSKIQQAQATVQRKAGQQQTTPTRSQSTARAVAKNEGRTP